MWSHDKFSDGAARGVAAGGNRPGAGKLLISNLDFGVNDSDINVSFSLLCYAEDGTDGAHYRWSVAT